jgi:hypothetical protein
MTSSPLVLPGVLFVGEDDRARLIALTGPAAGWLLPKGILGWSHELSVVPREALTEEIRRTTKAVMPEEQIPPAKYPLTLEAAKKSPLVAVSSRLVPKLVEAGARVHTIGVDRVTSSFYYLAEGGGEEPARVEGDLVQSVGAMLGERADNAAIERVLDGIVDRLLRALSRDRVSELAVELAAALPRAAADGSGLDDVDLDAFERDLGTLVGQSEKMVVQAREIADKLAGTYERKLDVPLFGDARKVSQGPFDLTVGEQKVALPTYERWIMAHVATEPGKAPPPEAKPSSDAKPAAAAKAAPRPASVPPARPAATPLPRPAAAKAGPQAPEDALANLEKVSEPKVGAAMATEKKAEPKPAEVKAEAPKPEPTPAEARAEAPRAEPKPAAAKPAEAKAEPKPAAAKPAEAKAEPKPAAAKAEAPKAEPKPAASKADKKKKKAEEKRAAAAAAKVEEAEAKAALKKNAEEPKAPAKEAEPDDKLAAKATTLKLKKSDEAPRKSSTSLILLIIAIALAAAWLAYRMLFAS